MNKNNFLCRLATASQNNNSFALNFQCSVKIFSEHRWRSSFTSLVVLMFSSLRFLSLYIFSKFYNSPFCFPLQRRPQISAAESEDERANKVATTSISHAIQSVSGSLRRRQMSLRTKRENTLTAMLVITCICFLICKAPISVNVLSQEFLCHEFGATYVAVASLIETLNHAANFLIYFAAGSKFRAACRRLLNMTAAKIRGCCR